jgi:hypothetical protein
VGTDLRNPRILRGLRCQAPHRDGDNTVPERARPLETPAKCERNGARHRSAGVMKVRRDRSSDELTGRAAREEAAEPAVAFADMNEVVTRSLRCLAL